jgi:hypothetical protein
VRVVLWILRAKWRDSEGRVVDNGLKNDPWSVHASGQQAVLVPVVSKLKVSYAIFSLVFRFVFL